MSATPTYAVVLTPAGRGAVASVLVAGPRALAITGSLIFRGQTPEASLKPDGRIRLARWADPAGEEVVVAALAQDRVEIHCHGGVAASQAVGDRLIAAGCRSLDWREWSALEEPNRIRGAAALALTQARTERTAAILLDQYSGAFASELANVQKLISNEDWTAAGQAVRRLLARWPIGAHLVDPWRIVLAGPPNVGKSSLINALVGYERTIVYDAPGTTRDLVAVPTALDGWPIELRDTAGLRETDQSLEGQGIALARRAADAADLVLLLFSATEPWTAADRKFIERWPQALPVYTKCDLATPPPDGRPAGIVTSAVTREGLDPLQRSMIDRLVGDPPPPGAAIPLDRQQVARLEQLLAAIEGRQIAVALAAVASCLDG